METIQTYAIIGDKRVKSIRVCNSLDEANSIAKNKYGDKAFAINTTDCPISVGDIYESNEKFYRLNDEGIREEIGFNPNFTEELEVLAKQNEEMTSMVIENEVAIVSVENGI